MLLSDEKLCLYVVSLLAVGLCEVVFVDPSCTFVFGEVVLVAIVVVW